MTSPREEFLAAAAGIEQVYRDTSGQIGYDGRQRVRKAYEALQQLGTYIPDAEPGQLAYGNMDDKAIAAAVRNAEKGLASPAVTLELVSQVRRLREELAAFGGPHGVTEDAIRSMVGEGFHTAFRKAVDSMEASIAWKAIRDMDNEEYAAIVSFTADPIVAALRYAEAKAADAAALAESEAVQEPHLENDPESGQAITRWAAEWHAKTDLRQVPIGNSDTGNKGYDLSKPEGS